MNQYIWANSCEAYAALIKTIRPRMKAQEKREKERYGQLELIDSPLVEVDETTRW